MDAAEARQVVKDKGIETSTLNCPPTCRLARDWIKMADAIGDDPGIRLAELEVPRDVVEDVVETTRRFIAACDAEEHFGWGYYQNAIREHDGRSKELSRRHRLALARDWLRLHRVAVTGRGSSA
jgi:hypothetical protein